MAIHSDMHCLIKNVFMKEKVFQYNNFTHWICSNQEKTAFKEQILGTIKHILEYSCFTFISMFVGSQLVLLWHTGSAFEDRSDAVLGIKLRLNACKSLYYHLGFQLKLTLGLVSSQA